MAQRGSHRVRCDLGLALTGRRGIPRGDMMMFSRREGRPPGPALGPLVHPPTPTLIHRVTSFNLVISKAEELTADLKET